jgi:hypothetical protein
MGDSRELRSSRISLASRVGVEESTHEAELVLQVHQNTRPLELYVHIFFELQKVHVYAAIIGIKSLSEISNHVLYLGSVGNHLAVEQCWCRSVIKPPGFSYGFRECYSQVCWITCFTQF